MRNRPSLFPLYLAPFEMLMKADDCPDYPMTFVIQVRLSGEVDRMAFEVALSSALQRHPLLCALVERRKKNQFCWVSAAEVRPAVDWRDDLPVSLPGGREAIDLAVEVGLRIWVRRKCGESILTLQFHHACCDGVGAYRFIGDLLAIYGDLTAIGDAERPILGPLDVTRLRTRSRGALDVALSGRSLRLVQLAVQEGLGVMSARATQLAPACKPGAQRVAGFPGVQSFRFERVEHEQLRQAARQHGAMLNDLLLAALFQTARNWNVRHTGRPGGRFRVMMPTDLRTIDDYETPAANKASYTFLTRRLTDLERPGELLESLRRETLTIRNERPGVRFADMLAGGFAVKGLMPILLSYPICMATAILSNVGDPSRRFTARFPRREGQIVCGNLTLEEITGASPLRRRIRATISAFAYNRRLTLCARCDPFSFTPDDTQAFLALYVSQLRSHLATSKSAPAARELATA